jgi:putative ABC transport system permease protein
VISESYWRARLNAAPDVLGRTMIVDGRPVTVVGVMPASFRMPAGTQLWLPSAYPVPPHPLHPERDPSALRDTHYFQTLARIAPGFAAADARAEVHALLHAAAAEHSDEEAVIGALLRPIRAEQVGDSAPALLILFGAAGVLLLIACANLGNLFLAEATNRQREWTVRTALGAGRWRLVRQRLVGSLMLSMLGGCAGLLVAIWGVALLQAGAPPDIAGLIDPSPDLRVLAFTAVISLATGIAFGVGPVLLADRIDLAQGLRAGGRGAGDSMGRRRMRGLLVITEVGLAFVLAIGAGLLGKAFARLQGVETGLNPDRVLTAGLVLPAAQYPDAAAQARFADQLLDRLRALPGISSASVISRLPFNPGSSSRSIEIEGRDPSAQELGPDYLTAGPEYLRSMGITLLGGREFTSRDGATAPGVAIVSQALARVAWPDRNAIGQRLRVGGDSAWLEVVGVAADVHQHGLDRKPRPTLYIPYAQDPWNRLTVVARTTGPVAGASLPVTAVIHQVDPDLAVSALRPMDDVVSASLSARRFNLTLIGLFAASALLLATLGIYGVVSYTVAQRSREVGIRMAVGAAPGQVVAMIMGQGARLAGGGVLIGLGAALVLTPLLRGLLYAITPTDLRTYIEAGGVLLGVALLACYVPARRATRVDPAVVLRSE